LAGLTDAVSGGKPGQLSSESRSAARDDMETSLSHDQLKDLIKAAVAEVLEERRDLLHQAVEEALEDVALARAIEEGESTELVGREEVFKLFEGQE
jgi:hypothetical protein